MQRSSESIASLAAALAKAQIELSNPEKSLVARAPWQSSAILRPCRGASRCPLNPICVWASEQLAKMVPHNKGPNFYLGGASLHFHRRI